MVPKSLEDYVDRKCVFVNTRYSNLCFCIPELAFGTTDETDNLLESETPGTSAMLTTEDFVETTLDEENSHQSSSDPLSPCVPDFSDDEADSDMSSDIE
jgi:hypothetical protein